MSDADLADALTRLKERLRRRAPPMLTSLRPAASPELLQTLERLLGRPLPPLLRELYAAHDGQDERAPAGLFLDGWFFIPLGGDDGLESEYGRMRQRADMARRYNSPASSGPVLNHLGDEGWFPFAKDFGGGVLCVDENPGPGGRAGQVILIDSEERRVLAPSLPAFLLQHASAP